MPTNNAWNSQNPAQVARGGTGRNTIADYNLIVGYGVNPVVLVAPDPVSGIPLTTRGGGANPNYGTAVVAGGGTGSTAFTSYSVICAGTTGQGPFHDVGTGVATQILTSNGPGLYPSWQFPTFGQYAFFAYNNILNSQTAITGNGANYHVIFNTTTVNEGGVWDTVNSRFIAPCDGLFYFSYIVKVTASLPSTTACTFDIYLNGPQPYRSHFQCIEMGPTVNSYSMTLKASALLNTNDVVYPSISINGFGGNVAGISDVVNPFCSWITGFLLSNI